MNVDDSVRVVVVTGAGGKSFISGQDISEFEALRSNPENTKLYEATTDRMYQGLKDCTKATIAMIPGFCMGVVRRWPAPVTSGFAQMMLSSPFPRPGSVSPTDPTSAAGLLMWLDHPRQRNNMTGRRYDAEEIQRLGLVERVVAKDDLEDYVTSYAATIAENAPLSVTANKLIINEVSEHPGIGTKIIVSTVQSCSDSDDYKEGRRAFMEKRPPKFTGA